MSALLRNNLGVVCGPCGFLNVVGAAKCMACGQPTDGPEQKSPPKAAQEANTSPAGNQAVPPGLKRATPPPEAPTAPPPAAAESSRAAPQPTQSGAKFGLAVLAGPNRGQKFRLAAAGAQVGRSKGVVLFPDDPFVSPLHATLTTRDGKLFVKDDESTSGVFISIAGQESLTPNSFFSAGPRLFRYAGPIDPAPAPAAGRITVYGAPTPPNQVSYLVEEVLVGGRPGKAIATPGPIVTVGQSKCDLNYPSDEGLAARHCELSPNAAGAVLRDLSGGLGTFVRISGERQLKAGDRLRVGQQTLQVEAL